MTTHLVVMGVSGCGKSTVAQGLAHRLGWPLAEGDDFHPQANIDKMSAGTPLTDADRWPWLATVVDWTTEHDAREESTVVTCSALRRVYRDLLRTAPGRTVFVHLDGDPELIAHRMAVRPHHFMPPSLLPSQLATLEPLQADEDGVVVSIDADQRHVVDRALVALGLAP